MQLRWLLKTIQRVCHKRFLGKFHALNALYCPAAFADIIWHNASTREKCALSLTMLGEYQASACMQVWLHTARGSLL